jgi:hypothetical protein
MNAETAGHAGTPQLKQFHMVYIKTKFPRGILDQVISSDNAPNMDRAHDGERERSPGPGLKLGEMDIASSKQQAASAKHQASSAKLHEQQAASVKPRGTSLKLQATSVKLQDS